MRLSIRPACWRSCLLSLNLFSQARALLHYPDALVRRDQYDEQLVSDSQKLMRWRNCHAHIFDILALPLDRKEKAGYLDQATNQPLKNLFNKCFDFLVRFCDKNQDNQQECFGQINMFLGHISIDGMRASECISAVFRDNASLCSKVSEKLVRRLMNAIVKHGKIAKWLRLILSLITVNGRPLRRTQDLVLKLLRESTAAWQTCQVS
jgi:hypothetical protein